MEDFAFASFLFHEGTNFEAWRFLGAHFSEENGHWGVRFRVWAPKASGVAVTGDFNYWDKNTAWHMNRVSDQGIWEIFIPGIGEYTNYKYLIYTADGRTLEKSDPFAFLSETKGPTASRVYDIDRSYPWTDEAYLAARKEADSYHSPMAIYECHLGSWRKYPDGNYFDYRKLADELVPYLLKMGYTHVELMPLSEYPFDGSWGYQVTGYFAPTSRFGRPEDLQYFVDRCHKNGIGVIMDWVPAHFPKDPHGLVEFDGGYLYECPNPFRMEHKGWGTRTFDYGRTEIQSFLVSSAMYWLDVYHIDGLRVDAVASMLYLDYDRGYGEWQPNEFGSNINLEAVAFFQKLNTAVFAKHPGILMIAEESTAYPGVTKPVHNGGLGFNYKWNMGWMNDMLRYFHTDPIYRKHHHSMMTNTFNYAFSENYILPISHDEVVHGKGSLLSKMPGNYDEMFANLRCFLAFMTVYPGKKLLFMGQELGQFKEWDYANGLDWNLLDFEKHRRTQEYVAALLQFYRSHPCLWELDFSHEGFRFVSWDDYEQNVIAFLRRDQKGKELLAVCNFSPVSRWDYKVGAQKGIYHQVFNSDDLAYGGYGVSGPERLETAEVPMHGYDHSLPLTLPPLAVILLEREQ